MAPKKQTEVEPARPSVEAILTDIHNSVVAGMEAVLAKLTSIEELLAQPRKMEMLPSGSMADEKTAKAIKEKTPKETVFLPVAQEDGTKKLVEQKPKAEKDAGKITIEMLRAKVSEFAEAFSMNEALAVNERFGGARKLSQIPEVAYEKVYTEMDSRLAVRAEAERALDEDAAAGGQASEPTITKEDIQKVGGAFVKQYGDPAFRELLAKFVAKGKEAKISQVDPAKYAALHEALANG